MQEKMTALFRKLELNGKIYYQCDFVVPEFVPNERFAPLQDRLFSNKDKFFITGTEEQLDNLGVKPNTIFYEKEGLHVLIDEEEKSLVSSKFNEILTNEKPVVEENKPKTVQDLINGYVEKIYNETKCHKGSIKEIIQTIVFNRDINNSVIPSRDKYLSHDNIVLYGPMGCGKSIILEALKRNLEIPTFELELTDDVEINKQMIVEAILNSNKTFNGNAVVIVDLDFNRFGQMFEGDAFYPLKELSNSSNLIYSPYLKKPINMRALTFITNVNVGENMLGIGDLHNYFIHISGCTKAVEVKKLSMFQTRKILYESAYSKLKFCENEAKKYNREFMVNKKVMALIIKYCELFNGNIMMIDAAIMESFKIQLNAGYKKIIIGDETLAILKGIIESETRTTWVEQSPENNVESEEDEEQVKIIDLNEALLDKEQAIDDIVEQIKKVIKGQDDKIRDLVSDIIDNQEIAHDPNEEDPESNKTNILIRGASGTGKTAIIRLIAKILDIPMVVEDATSYTEEGYVGKSVTDMLLHLYRKTGKNIEKAERGIIVIDEIDKKANNGVMKSDVSRGAVLDSLLKMVEGEQYELEYKEAVPQGNIIKTLDFDTRRLTFIGLGAFEGLDKIKEERIQRLTKPKKIGLMSQSEQNEVEKELKGISRDFTNEDYESFGFTKQFVNRFDKKMYLNDIGRDSMIEIMKYSTKSPLLLMQNKFAKYGIEVEYTDDFYERLADLAMTKKSGARSIKEVFGDLKQFIGFNQIRKSKYSKIIFNAACFDDPNALVLIEKEQSKKLVK